MQIPYKVDSGQTPRKVEMERRRRQYARQVGTIDALLHELKVNTQDLMPVADHTARALLDFSGKGHPTPTFPSFLPLEVFDNTEFDCRTPKEWVALGEPVCLSPDIRPFSAEKWSNKGFFLDDSKSSFSFFYFCSPGNEDEGVCKPVPGKALLPVLESSTPSSPHTLTPTPPTGQPPSDISRPTRMYDCMQNTLGYPV